ncbi:Protein of unknown function [Gryllus bimaculatus]|nr:Protein of unknown function [Gryllus bimaculatus]
MAGTSGESDMRGSLCVVFRGESGNAVGGNSAKVHAKLWQGGEGPAVAGVLAHQVLHVGRGEALRPRRVDDAGLHAGLHLPHAV